MKTFFILLPSILWICSLNAQTGTIRYEIDYFTWNNLDDKNVIFLNQLNNGHQIIRQVFKHKPTKIEWEIIEISDSQYLYLSYNDSSMIQVESGILEVTDNCIEDTIIYFEPITFEEQVIYNRRKQLVKQGFWEEKDSSWKYRGYYKNGLRDGKWTIYGLTNNNDLDIQNWIFDNGKLLSKTLLNIITPKNQDTILHYLAQTWNIQNTINSNFVRLERLKNDVLIIPFLIFNQNNTFDYCFSTSIGCVKTRKGTWEINNDFLLELKFDNENKSKIYTIEYLFKDYLELKRED
jgi:hypothetical protein